MDNQRIDIELIAKYYNGKLDGKAMQQLEERALEDPFLAEAMEGFSEYSIHKNDVIDLKERLKDRLRIRTAKKNTGSFGFRNWYLAASIIILIGFISIYINLPEGHVEDNNVLKTAEKGITENDAEKERFHNDTISDKEAVIEKSPVIVSLEKPDFDSDEVMASSDQIILESATASAFVVDSTKRENVIASYSSKSGDDFAAKSLSTARNAMLGSVSNNIVKGKVIDSEYKSPVSGVSVIDISTGISTITDVNGEFKILAETDSKLSFHNLGYLKKESEVTFNDSLKIYLKRDNASLSEVAVIGYGTVAKKQSAGPKEGWSVFKKYLNDNNELETNETGAVVVEFIINSNGGLSDFKVVKSLSKLADARAISLIKNYSSWQGASDGTASKAKVTLRFK